MRAVRFRSAHNPFSESPAVFNPARRGSAPPSRCRRFRVPRWSGEEGGLMPYSARYVELFRMPVLYVDKS